MLFCKLYNSPYSTYNTVGTTKTNFINEAVVVGVTDDIHKHCHVIN